MSKNEKVIFVFADWYTPTPVMIGQLYANVVRGNEMFSFEYDTKWIQEQDSSLFFDPDLQLYVGRQYVLDKPLFGIFSDSCPDRWGRLLMNRRETILARRDGRKPVSLNESDYLLGVHDETRMGAMRFSLSEKGPFLSDSNELSAPPWTTLRKLEAASWAFENAEDNQEEKWLNQLLVPGSSLGGARPKASIKAPNDSLWIAKFPSKNDEWDSGVWEIVAHKLAGMCGLKVPEAKAEMFSKEGHTFLVKRFDREFSKRIHFSSAMALLGKVDGQQDVGYLDIVSFIRSNGASPKQDLIELWKRIIFNMAINNTDDHLRNHGFLFTRGGWVLSPLFDVNPIPYGNHLSLNVSENDNSIDFVLALETAKHYGLSEQEATKIMNEILETVTKNWYTIAKGYGLSSRTISEMEPAFVFH